ncbi:TRAP transporter large permease [Sneathiella chinensis]|uniref:TRAP transporter large permease protein n=1 Tax=Sneathiella chinensis TaxID=349750 RepID=A0ABQ5U654_9PROT|nr:TRAP transporter large permease [Sneathiella chinensis]GLQ06861.1 C4-dicarboxylate ABC transporter permease [Sneathiella chinensis]
MTAFGFAALLSIGMPVAFVLLASTFIFMFSTGNFRVLDAMPQIIFSGLEIFDLLAIPLFILLGEIMNAGGITRRLIGAAQLMLGRLPNSLAYVSLTANLMLASIMGSATAQIAIMSRVMVPQMEKDGYSRSFSAALVAGAGMLGPVIPPSMIFIIFGVVAQASIADMFIGGILPGTFLFVLLVVYISIKNKIRIAPETAEVAEREGLRKSLFGAAAGMSIPVIIVCGISFGIVTPTESAALATGVAIFLGFCLYRDLKISDLSDILGRTASNSALVLFLIATAKVFGWVLTYNQVPQAMAEVLQSLTSSAPVFLLLVFAFAILVGAFLDGIAALIILVPILLPIATGVYGIDPIHFGVVVCMTLTIGLLTPPVGTGLYIASAVANVPFPKLVREIIPFVLITMLVVIATILFPALVM